MKHASLFSVRIFKQISSIFALKLTCLFFLSNVAYSQPKQKMSLLDLPPAIDTLTGQAVYTEVVSVSGVTADLLYERAKSWLVSTFQSSKSIIDSEDKSSGTLISKPLISVLTGKKGLLDANSNIHRVSLDIRCKDGRYRYELTPLDYMASPTEARLGGVASLPLSTLTNTQIKRIRRKGELYRSEYDDIWRIDSSYKTFIERVKNAMSQPGKGEF